MFSILRPFLFKIDPEIAHDLAIKSLKLNVIPENFFRVENENILETNMFDKKLMSGKKGLVMGVANDRSISWAIAKKAYEYGAELAFTYQGDALGKRVIPLGESVGSNIILPCEVSEASSIKNVFETDG